MYALYAFCAIFLWNERSRVAEVSRNEHLLATTKGDSTAVTPGYKGDRTAALQAESRSREQLQAQVDQLNRQLIEARASISQAPQPVVQQASTDPGEFMTLSKFHFLTDKEKTFIKDGFVLLGDKAFLRTKGRVRQDGDAIATTTSEILVIAKDGNESILKKVTGAEASAVIKTKRNRFRINGDYLEVEQTTDGVEGSNYWEKTLKIGARPGEQWEEELSVALSSAIVKNKYKFVGFKKVEGVPLFNAIVECETTTSNTKTGSMKASTMVSRTRRSYGDRLGLIKEELSSDLGKGGEMVVTMRQKLDTK